MINCHKSVCRVLPFWRTANVEMFRLNVAGLASPSQPPLTGLGAGSPHPGITGLIVPRAGLVLAQAMRQHCPTAALGLLGCSARRSLSSCLHPTKAGSWEGEEVFCCGCSTKGWLWEHGSWRRRLGGAGFPAIVGEIFLLCFSHKRLAVADAVGAATGLLGRWWGLLPVPAGLPVFSQGQRGPCLRSNAPHRGCRAGSSGGYAAGWLGESGADAYVYACHCK